VSAVELLRPSNEERLFEPGFSIPFPVGDPITMDTLETFLVRSLIR